VLRPAPRGPSRTYGQRRLTSSENSPQVKTPSHPCSGRLIPVLCSLSANISRWRQVAGGTPVDVTTDSLRFILGLKLKGIRQERGYSLSDLARHSGLSVSYLSEIESGRKY